jgi:hypothetical protein
MKLLQIDDLPVLDAKKSVKLIVTEEDVKGGNPKKPNTCAVAKACMRQMHVKEVRVHLGRVYVRSNNLNWQRFITSRAMRTEVIAFDRGGRFAPGEYILKKITPAAATGKQQGSDKKTKKRSKSKGIRRAYHVVTDVRVGPA